MKMFEVGGCVRDEILGVPSKDIDFSVVLDKSDLFDVEDPYTFMVEWLENLEVKVIRDNDGEPIGAPFLTARGIAPKSFPVHPGRALDFVLARRESGYSDGRRPDNVQVGTLEDDLGRRDFTMNAIAKDVEGNLIDPFGGVRDIERGVIRTVGDPFDRFNEDALRALRALRFSVTKGFVIEKETAFAMQSLAVLQGIMKVSDERKREELNKMLAFSTMGSLVAFNEFPALTRAVFDGSVSLEATMKKRKIK